MSNRANDAVSIQLRNLDGISLEEEYDKEDGQGPAEILKAREETMRWWNTFFIMLCAFAVFINPLFCYIHVIEKDKMCISYDLKLAWTYIGLRVVIDIFYFIDIIIFLCGICKTRKGRKFGACCWKQRADQKSTGILKQVIKRRCFLLLSILPRILVALPIPEGLLFFAVFVVYFDAVNAIFIITPFQYTLRIVLIYGSKR